MKIGECLNKCWAWLAFITADLSAYMTTNHCRIFPDIIHKAFIMSSESGVSCVATVWCPGPAVVSPWRPSRRPATVRRRTAKMGKTCQEVAGCCGVLHVGRGSDEAGRS